MNDDLISRQAIIEKLKEHHDFFVNAYNGFENMPSNIKLRVDEITNCIAEVVNIPAVQPEQETGEWVHGEFDIPHCSICGHDVMPNMVSPYCPNCGAKMESEVTE